VQATAASPTSSLVLNCTLNSSATAITVSDAFGWVSAEDCGNVTIVTTTPTTSANNNNTVSVVVGALTHGLDDITAVTMSREFGLCVLVGFQNRSVVDSMAIVLLEAENRSAWMASAVSSLPAADDSDKSYSLDRLCGRVCRGWGVPVHLAL
jgi:hypothetical protein